MYTGQKILGKKAQSLVKNGAILIDLRDPVSYRDGTLPGAINLSLRRISDTFKHPKTTIFVLFGGECDESTVKAAINYMSEYGFPHIYTMGSKSDWDK